MSSKQQQYEVALSSRQMIYYLVEADDPKSAEARAVERWRNAEPGDFAGGDGETLGLVWVAEAAAPEARTSDAESVYHLLGEREQRLLEELQRDAFDLSTHDAVSATEVAFHLGWIIRDAEDRPLPHTSRAARALEQLCDQRRVVCFTRPRVRGGERGEIRLYCTPQHLENLTQALQEVES